MDCESVQSKQGFGKSIYFLKNWFVFVKIEVNQRYITPKNRRKIFEQVFTVVCFHVMLFIKHEKDTQFQRQSCI